MSNLCWPAVALSRLSVSTTFRHSYCYRNLDLLSETSLLPLYWLVCVLVVSRHRCASNNFVETYYPRLRSFHAPFEMKSVMLMVRTRNCQTKFFVCGATGAMRHFFNCEETSNVTDSSLKLIGYPSPASISFNKLILDAPTSGRINGQIFDCHSWWISLTSLLTSLPLIQSKRTGYLPLTFLVFPEYIYLIGLSILSALGRGL
jgi:hypothetical protein